MRSRSNGGVIGAYALPTQNYANGVFFIHDAAIYNTGNNPIWPLATGFIYSATGGTISTAVDNTNYKTHTFTANGTFSVVTGSAYVDVLLVGGGGGCSSIYLNGSSYGYAQGGGGGGTVALVQNLLVTPGTVFTVEVGLGGATVLGGTQNVQGNNGNPSKITSNRGHSIIAKGGGAGGTFSTFTSKVGGSGGGGGFSNVGSTDTSYAGSASGSIDSYSIDTATATFMQNAGAGGGNVLSSGSASYLDIIGGGGGGATEPGYAGNYATDTSLRTYGGNGYQWSRTGYYYGAGGCGGSYGNTILGKSGLQASGTRLSEGTAGTAGYGGGGNGSYAYVPSGFASVNGWAGGTGTVIFAYRYQ
jgi:hypothetical protein